MERIDTPKLYILLQDGLLPLNSHRFIYGKYHSSYRTRHSSSVESAVYSSVQFQTRCHLWDGHDAAPDIAESSVEGHLEHGLLGESGEERLFMMCI